MRDLVEREGGDPKTSARRRSSETRHKCERGKRRFRYYGLETDSSLRRVPPTIVRPPDGEEPAGGIPHRKGVVDVEVLARVENL